VRRAEVLARFLRASGFTSTIRTLGFGKRCPLTFSSGANYTPEQQWQILRRVEVIAGKDVPSGQCRGEKPVVGAVVQAAQ
jgi:outer membrane protein OmpA-like peptidoglycan-associated protein